MYEAFFRLNELPFELTPNTKYLFLTPKHREALSALEYGLSSAKAITLLLGEVGTGKTTLLHAALRSERCRNVTCVYVNNPALSRREFTDMLALRLGMPPLKNSSKAEFLYQLERVLRERRQHGNITALIVDEAQGLSSQLLEEIRLLANTETETEKLLPLVLAGQPELKERLNTPELRQLKQRVTLRCEIAPLTSAETAAYVAERIAVAGGDVSEIFSREAIVSIHRFSRGLPRTVNVMCDNALVTAFGLGIKPVTLRVVQEVARDFDLTVPDPTIGPAATAAPVPALAAVPPKPEEDARPALEADEKKPETRIFSWLGAKKAAAPAVGEPRLFARFR